MCPETGRYLKVPQKHLLKEALPWKKDDFIFERMIDGVPVNYVRETLCLLMSRLLNGKTKMEHFMKDSLKDGKMKY